jgi:hypothetical protein
MTDNWEILAALAAIAVYVAHDFLASGFHEQIPVGGETASIGVGLALLAAGGVYVNARIYDSQ